MASFASLFADDPGSFGHLAELRTNDGKQYQTVEIIKIDPNGVIFRHSKGIAKVVFPDLNPALQERFGYDPAAAEAFVEKGKDANRATNQQTRSKRPTQAVVIVAKPARSTKLGICQTNQLVGLFPQLPYPLRLAQYPYRRLAELDFLYTTGLVPRPPGVRVHRLH